MSRCAVLACLVALALLALPQSALALPPRPAPDAPPLMQQPGRTPRDLARELAQEEAALDQALAQLRIERYGTNPLLAWCLRYGQHLMRHDKDGPRAGEFCPPSAIHADMTERLHHALTCREPLQRIVGGYGRSLGKTTYATIMLPLWAAVEQGRRNILLICKTEKEGEDRLAEIAEEIETNQELRRAYPGLLPARDSKSQWKSNRDDSLILANGARIKIYAFGKGALRGSLRRGDRPDLVILDDPESDDYKWSPTIRTRGWEWLQATLVPALTDYAVLVWLGTPVCEDCLLLKARAPRAQGGLAWDGPWVPYATELPEAVGGDGSAQPRWQPAWPERDTPQITELKLASLDPLIAKQEWLLIPVSAANPPLDIAWYDDSLYPLDRLKQLADGGWEFDGVRLSAPVAHWDSASSTAATADYSAVSVGCLHPGTREVFFLPGAVYGHLRQDEQIEAIKHLHETARLRCVRYECVRGERDMAVLANLTGYIPFDEVPVNTTLAAKFKRINALALPLKNRKLRFPNDGSYAHVRQEMTGYNGTKQGGHDDALDTVEHVYSALTSGAGSADTSGIQALRVALPPELGPGW